MKTKKEYITPKVEQIELELKYTMLAGSETDVDPSGDNWEDD